MTTIAYKDGILAADTQLTYDGHIKGVSTQKIRYLPSGVLFAGAGNVKEILMAENFYSQPNWEDKLDEAPPIKKSFEAIIVSKGRVLTLNQTLLPDIMADKFCSCGSGWKLAHAAMAMGLGAYDAIKFTATLDVFTNDEIQVINVQEFFEEQNKKRTGRASKRKAV
jgi:hypothetical protein